MSDMIDIYAAPDGPGGTDTGSNVATIGPDVGVAVIHFGEELNAFPGMMVWLETPDGTVRCARLDDNLTAYVADLDPGSWDIHVRTPGLLVAEQILSLGSGTFPVGVGDWGTGWDMFVICPSCSPVDAKRILRYSRKLGLVELTKLDTDSLSAPPLWTGEWEMEWTHITAVGADSDWYTLQYNTSTGKTAISRVDADTVTSVWSSQWTSGWTSFASLPPSDESLILEYKKSSGLVVIDRLNAQGIGVSERSRFTHIAGWELVSPLAVGLDTFVLWAAPQTGVYRLDRYHRDNHTLEQVPVEISMLPSLSVLRTFHIGGKIFLYQYRALDGHVQIVKLDLIAGQSEVVAAFYRSPECILNLYAIANAYPQLFWYYPGESDGE